MFYDAILNEYGITGGLTAKGLDPAWVQAVNDHLKAVEGGQLTEEQITEKQDELNEMFLTSHDELTGDDPETTALKDQNKVKDQEILRLKNENLMKQAGIDVSAAPDIATLEKLKETYKDLPDAIKLIDDRILTLGASVDKQRRDAAREAIAKSVDVAALEKMKEDWNQDKEIVKLVNARVKVVNKEAQQKKTSTDVEAVVNALRAVDGKHVTYKFLKDLGIEATGDDMTVHGVQLSRLYYFRAYQVNVPK